MNKKRDPKTSFDLLLGELAAVLKPESLRQARAVFASWAGQEIHVPHERSWTKETATLAARRMLASGTPVPVARDRLIGIGVGRTSAYKILGRVREEMQHADAA